MIKSLNPNFRERIQAHIQKQHFLEYVGFKITSIEEGCIEGFLVVKQFHKQQRDFIHGGLIATLADVVAGFAAYTLVPEDHHVVTAELKVSYLNPGLGNKLEAKGWVLKQGKKMNFCESEVWSLNEDQRTLIAKATTTMATVFPGEFQS